MRQIQNADAAQGLEEQFGLRGKIGVALDEIVVPVVNVGDFDGRSPYEPARRLGGDIRTSAAAGALTFAGILITPGPNTLLALEVIAPENLSGTTHRYEIKLFRPTDIAAVTVVAASAMARWDGRMRATGFAPQMACTTTTFHHTTLGIGAACATHDSFNGNPLSADIGRGFMLDGTDPLGPISVAVMTQIANAAFSVNFVVVEYPQKI